MFFDKSGNADDVANYVSEAVSNHVRGIENQIYLLS